MDDTIKIELNKEEFIVIREKLKDCCDSCEQIIPRSLKQKFRIGQYDPEEKPDKPASEYVKTWDPEKEVWYYQKI